jgi:flavorubredoxin
MEHPDRYTYREEWSEEEGVSLNQYLLARLA